MFASAAREYAIETYGQLNVDIHQVNVIPVSESMAKYLGCDIGFGIDVEIE